MMISSTGPGFFFPFPHLLSTIFLSVLGVLGGFLFPPASPISANRNRGGEKAERVLWFSQPVDSSTGGGVHEGGIQSSPTDCHMPGSSPGIRNDNIHKYSFMPLAFFFSFPPYLSAIFLCDLRVLCVISFYSPMISFVSLVKFLICVHLRVSVVNILFKLTQYTSCWQRMDLHNAPGIPGAG